MLIKLIAVTNIIKLFASAIYLADRPLGHGLSIFLTIIKIDHIIYNLENQSDLFREEGLSYGQ